MNYKSVYAGLARFFRKIQIFLTYWEEWNLNMCTKKTFNSSII